MRRNLPLAALSLGLATGPLQSQEADPNWETGAAPAVSLVVGGSDFLAGGFGILGFAGRKAINPLWIRADIFYLGLDASQAGAETADNALLSLHAGATLYSP